MQQTTNVGAGDTGLADAAKCIHAFWVARRLAGVDLAVLLGQLGAFVSLAIRFTLYSPGKPNGSRLCCWWRGTGHVASVAPHPVWADEGHGGVDSVPRAARRPIWRLSSAS